MAQRVDLDSDSSSDDRARTATTRRVPLARPAISIEPRDGTFGNGAGDSLQVSHGYVVSFFFFTGTSSPCGVGLADNVLAPIDPQTGRFSFSSTGTDLSPPVETTARGTFTDASSLVLDAQVAWQGCTYDVTPDSFD